ncbi:hypothetical protein L198_06478 [Cryptococcus wingfieldii CBS 7118]|uniref:Cullin N-terminal domain-containing protein n=1 Tax=Cryptococcus wingfieldii CBS 7118 TaxID=1295528 RepID=A0A1E3IKW3_9TREE|nr:hypothetical protein L198_06478 [Cryptococcus wingfieldii CBS 7118]ODN89158.1 hypothetical protein L198_06478 [Cryptococcus wingfieldii CBS 7118]
MSWTPTSLASAPPAALDLSDDDWTEPRKEDIPPRDASFDDTWDFLEAGLERIYTVKANPALGPFSYTYYSELYAHANSLAWSTFPRTGRTTTFLYLRPEDIILELMYAKLKQFFRTKAQDAADTLARPEAWEDFIDLYTQAWDVYFSSARFVNNLFRGLNYRFADTAGTPANERCRVVDRGIGVQKLAFNIWKETLFGQDIKSSYTAKHLDIALHGIGQRDSVDSSKVTEAEKVRVGMVEDSLVSLSRYIAESAGQEPEEDDGEPLEEFWQALLPSFASPPPQSHANLTTVTEPSQNILSRQLDLLMKDPNRDPRQSFRHAASATSSSNVPSATNPSAGFELAWC